MKIQNRLSVVNDHMQSSKFSQHVAARFLATFSIFLTVKRFYNFSMLLLSVPSGSSF